MSAFDYTSGNPANLVGGTNASMADIQGPFTDLKAFLNSRIAAIPAVVSSLPAGPVDGQEIYYLADASNGVVWHLRYRSASGSTYKWECLGGPYIQNEATAAAGTVTNTAYTGFALTLTAPLAGDYDVTVYSQGITKFGANGIGYLSYAVGATPASDSDAVQQFTVSAQDNILSQQMTRRKTITAAATVLTLQARVTAGSLNINNNAAGVPYGLRMVPVRVG